MGKGSLLYEWASKGAQEECLFVEGNPVVGSGGGRGGQARWYKEKRRKREFGTEATTVTYHKITSKCEVVGTGHAEFGN